MSNANPFKTLCRRIWNQSRSFRNTSVSRPPSDKKSSVLARGDPNSPGQSLYTPTTEDWPPLMRINPILEWSYQNIWDFLRRCHLPYCRLYDAGYTSIGSISDTRPNSSLKKENGSYAPAYLLSDGRLERLGRRKVMSFLPSMNEGFGIQSHSNGGLDISTLTKKAALLIIGDELLSGKVAFCFFSILNMIR